MATSLVKIEVDDAEFQRFVNNFTRFTEQVDNLSQKWEQLNTKINRTAQSGNFLTRLFQGTTTAAGNLFKITEKITGHFLRWGTIIGSVTALLGFGGGLFGITRLADTIMQKRRQVMGLGGTTYGAMQAWNIYGQSIFQNPQAILQNIAMGMHGDPTLRPSLARLGNIGGVDPFQQGMKPDEWLEQSLPRIVDFLKQAPGLELSRARAIGLTDIIRDPTDIMRLVTGGRKELEEIITKVKAAEKETDLSKEAQEGWKNLDIQLAKAKGAIESVFGESLLGLTEPLQHLSDAFVEVVRKIMTSQGVRDALEWVTKKLNEFAEYLTSTQFDKDLKKWEQDARDWIGTLTQLKSALDTFVSYLNTINDALNSMGETMRKVWNPTGFKPTPADPNRLKDLNKPGFGDMPFDPSLPGAPPATPQQYLAPTMPGTGGAAGGSAWNIMPGSAASFALGSTNITGIGGNAFGGMNIGGARVGSNVFPQTSINPMTSLAFARNAIMRSGPNIFQRNRDLAPWQREYFKSPEETGPLALSNWEGTRKSSLVVRNVPGSNVFLTAQGMAGAIGTV